MSIDKYIDAGNEYQQCTFWPEEVQCTVIAGRVMTFGGGANVSRPVKLPGLRTEMDEESYRTQPFSLKMTAHWHTINTLLLLKFASAGAYTVAS